MTCPRCSQPLSTLSLDGRAARYCERCGFVGVETVHERDAPNRESWDDAIARFHARAVRGARERDEGVVAEDEGGDDESADGDNESADGDNESEPEGDEADADNSESDAATDESDATEGVAESGAVEADETGDSDAADRESSDYQRKNGEDGDRGDRTGDE
ncbi:small CPxCG-related zinc finger protein [Haloferax gibbonsii]|uniref:Small CPxCG-related zinc finger protein n=1 Tax=Haloferax gibbonsii TaxID=35746 RepID=A0A871BI95_HALGI|nr:zinc finger domain-containing protein [Haloferax gibbonsii]QOS12867.1 small CPxCG-related zinc finger protein [Haloferax gibbonsii]